MKLTPVQAMLKIQAELDKGNGAYTGPRFYKVRVQGGVLQVSYDFATFEDVVPGSQIRNGHGGNFFVYEPTDDYPRLVVSEAKVKHPEWERVFTPGEQIEIVRQTPQFYIIAPMGFEQKVSKSRMRVTGHTKTIVAFTGV